MNFIESYKEYCTEFTDSPAIFHSRIALSVLSTVLGRKVFVWQGYKRLFPNLWLIVVAPSSFFRKSYSLGIAEDILREVGGRTDEKFILPREFSHERFVEILAEQPQGLLISYEFKTFMAMMSRDYMAGTQAMITELFDCPSVYDRKTKMGSYEIHDPFLNILSATTIDWFKTSVKDMDLTSGFLPRFLVVSYSGKKETMIPWQKANDITKKDILIEKLVKISKLSGPCEITKEAMDYYEGWYRQFEHDWSRPGLLTPFFARLQEYAKKLSILIAVDRTCTLKIDSEHMETACNFADEYASEIKGIVEEDLTHMDKNQKKVIDVLKHYGEDGITREELIRKTRLLADRQLDPILRTFIESQQVKAETKPFRNSQGAERTKTTYYWTNGNYEI